MMQYEKLVEVAYSQNRLSEEFFLSNMKMLKDSALEREQFIRLRQQVSQHILEDIESEQSAKEQKARCLTHYSPERIALLRGIDSLQKERRSELRQAVKDISQWSKEAQEKREEYLSMAELFKSALVSRRE